MTSWTAKEHHRRDIKRGSAMLLHPVMPECENSVLKPVILLKKADTPILTAIRYRPMVDPMLVATHPSSHQTSEALPFVILNSADFSAHCLAIGIGPECGNMVFGLGRASWFEHLRETIVHSELTDGLTGSNTEASFWFSNALPHSHVASIAMSKMITSEDIDLACMIGRLLMKYHTFVVITSSSTNPDFVARLGQACDCLISGDGSRSHHQYPIRTVIEPASGRLVCYDLHDVCCMWAGHSGEYGFFRSDADAVHIEVSTQVGSLNNSEAIVNNYRIQLNNQANLKLFNVVDGLGQLQAVPTSFRRTSDFR